MHGFFQAGELEYLGIDLSLEASQLKDLYDLRWTSETGMVENMEMIVQEYKEARQLLVSLDKHIAHTHSRISVKLGRI